METLAEEDENKLPLKRVELSLSKFNEVAIPHYLDLLRQHKANIIKHETAGEGRRARAEREAARRAAARLRALLAELAALRRAVRPTDRAAFDALTAGPERDARAALDDYTESSPTMTRRAADSVEADGVASRESVESVGTEEGVRLQVDERSLALAEREQALRGWGEVEREAVALRATWRAVHEAARAQGAAAAHVERHAEAAAGAVAGARAHLALGERLRGAGRAGAALGGAALGALAAGPLGLVVGAKAGAAAALAGSLLGYAAGRLLPLRAPAPPAPAPAPAPDEDEDEEG